MTRFGVSRTVARETVQALAMLGLVNVQHGKRTEVCPPEDWDILSSVVQEALRREGKAEPLLRDLYEFRLLIEPQAAAWMAEHGSERGSRAPATSSPTRWSSSSEDDVAVADVMDADRSFHDLVARASENRVARGREPRHPRGDRHALGLLEPRAPRMRARCRRAAPAHRRRDPAARRRSGGRRRCATTCAGPRRPICTASASRPGCGARRWPRRSRWALVVGIDTGGTFTDMVVFDPATGQDRLAQDVVDAQLARPGDRERARRGRCSRPPSSRRSRTGRRSGTNALIERTGCKVAFVTTKGFEDTPLHPAHQPQGALRPALAQAGAARREPAPLPRARRAARRGGSDAPGRSTRQRGAGALPARSATRAPRPSRSASSSRTSAPSTRRRVKQILAEELPGVPVSVSHEVAPIWREYERSSTTIADAYLRPLFGRYVGSLDAALRDAGMTREWTLMKSNGGAMLSGAAAGAPIQTVMSGPGRRHDRDRAHRRARSASRTCSRSTWAARAPTSASSSTASSATRPSTRSSGACPRRCR